MSNQINITWTIELKTAYAEVIMAAMKNAKINPRYPKCIYAEIDEAGNVTGFDSTPAVHIKSLTSDQVCIDMQFDPDGMGDGWGEPHTVLDIVDFLDSNESYRAISEILAEND